MVNWFKLVYLIDNETEIRIRSKACLLIGDWLIRGRADSKKAKR